MLELMQREAGHAIHELKVDGGATANRFLMQFQADLLGIPVLRSDRTESTAWGAAKLAGIQCGFWKEVEAIDRFRRWRKFSPRMTPGERRERLGAWREAVKKLVGPFEKGR